MALGPEDLVLCAGTLAAASLETRVAAASAAGFRGLSLFPSDLRRARAEGLDDARLRGMLAEAGLEVAEIDPLMSWLPGAAAVPGPFESSEDECYEIAERIGGRGINAVVYTDAPRPQDEIVESFAALCDRAAERGLLVHLEFMPWTQIGSATDALAIVEAADRPNGGILLDTWHHFRSRLDDAALKEQVPAERILAVQLSDAPRSPEPDPVAETLQRRRIPGDGDIDLPGLLRFLRDGGSPAPLGVEVFCEDLANVPDEEVARRCADGVRAALTRR